MRKAGLRPPVTQLPGKYVSIETTTMRDGNTEPVCGGREWDIVEIPDGTEVYDAITDAPLRSDELVVCEHMLEMD